MWNLLDYPSTILPLKKFKIDPEKDQKDVNFVPKDNIFDKMNWEICESICYQKGSCITDYPA